MTLLYIFIIGCFVTGIVAVGLVFAFAAAGYGTEEPHHIDGPQEIAPEPAAAPNQDVYRL